MQATIINTVQIVVKHYRFYTLYLGKDIGECIMEVHFIDAGQLFIQRCSPVPSCDDLYKRLNVEDREEIERTIYQHLKIPYPPLPAKLHTNWNGTLSYITDGDPVENIDNIYEERYRGHTHK